MRKAKQLVAEKSILSSPNCKEAMTSICVMTLNHVVSGKGFISVLGADGKREYIDKKDYCHAILRKTTMNSRYAMMD